MISNFDGQGAGPQEEKPDFGNLPPGNIPPGMIPVVMNPDQVQEAIRSALPEAVAEFHTPRASKEVEEILTSTPERFMKFFRRMKSEGKIPIDWPEPELKPSKEYEGMEAQNMETSVLCAAIRFSKETPEGFEYLPSSVLEIEDWIWQPAPGVALIYMPDDKALSPAIGESYDLVQKAAHCLKTRSLAGITAEDLDGRSDMSASSQREVSLASTLVAMMRASYETLDKETRQKLDTRTQELTGMNESQAMEFGVFCRLALWNYLLRVSPRFRYSRAAVIYYRQDDGRKRGDVHFAQLICSWDELMVDEHYLRRLASSIQRPNGVPNTDVIVVLETDPSFHVYADEPVWEQMRMKDCYLSNDAKQRVRRWDHEVQASFRSHDDEPES